MWLGRLWTGTSPLIYTLKMPPAKSGGNYSQPAPYWHLSLLSSNAELAKLMPRNGLKQEWRNRWTGSYQTKLRNNTGQVLYRHLSARTQHSTPLHQTKTRISCLTVTAQITTLAHHWHQRKTENHSQTPKSLAKSDKSSFDSESHLYSSQSRNQEGCRTDNHGPKLLCLVSNRFIRSNVNNKLSITD